MHIAIISASTRINRQSHRVALGLEKLIQNRTSHNVSVIDLAEFNFPIMEEVLSRHPNPPEGLSVFSEQVMAADAFIFVSPEYNGSYTAALKNAVDYLKESEFTRKVIGVATVTSGPMGGMRAALAIQQLAHGIGGFTIPQMLLVGNVATRFDEAGDLIDPSFEKNIQSFLNNFLWLSEAVVEKKESILA